MPLKIEIAPSLGAVPAAEWNALAGTNPFIQHHFLHLLQETACAAPHTGWTPCHVLLREQGVLQGAVAAYLKTHSRGEFVFDQSWAQAYQQHGLDYYPKLVVSVPFTPVAGPRLLAHKPEHQALLIRGLMALAQQAQATGTPCRCASTSIKASGACWCRRRKNSSDRYGLPQWRS